MSTRLQTDEDTFVSKSEYENYFKHVEEEVISRDMDDSSLSTLQVTVKSTSKLKDKTADKSSAEKEASAELRFKQGDENGDGKLTFGEFIHTSKYLLDWQRNEFKKMDRNRNKFISKQEYGEYYTKLADVFRSVKGQIFADAIRKYRFDPKYEKELYEGDIVKLLEERYRVKPKTTFTKIFTTFDKNANYKWDVEEFVMFDTNFPWDAMDPIED
uniref:EF-hand domain-containing protein n=1 Tax=Plectus sambesii TaxID=2011161 RepID=A0A914V8K6_9BILA